MAEQLPNRFSSFALTAEEELRGSVYSTEQKWVLQNKLAETAMIKTALTYDPEHPLLFAQEEAGHAAELLFIEYLLDTSDAAEQAIMELRNPNEDTNLEGNQQ